MNKHKLSQRMLEKMVLELDAEVDVKIDHTLLRKLISLGTLLKLPAGRNFVTAGVVNPNIYIMVDGIMRSWYQDGDKEVTEAFGLCPSIIMSYHSYCMGLPALSYFEACTPVKVLEIPRESYDTLINQNPEFAKWCLRVAQTQLFYHELRRRTYLGAAKERYIAFIQRRPQIMRQVSLRKIASYLGITPQYLYKLRSEVR